MKSSQVIFIAILVLVCSSRHLTEAENTTKQDVAELKLAKLPSESKTKTNQNRGWCKLVVKMGVEPDTSESEAIELLSTLLKKFDSCEPQGNAIVDPLRAVLKSNQMLLIEKVKLKVRPKPRGLFYGRK